MRALLVLVVLTAAFAAAGTARADGWCGEEDAACDASLAYVECADGTIWLVDPSLVAPEDFGTAMCDAGYRILQPDVSTPPLPAPIAEIEPGPLMAPDPALYSGEVTCPDGAVWAIARGDADFSCPPSDPP